MQESWKNVFVGKKVRSTFVGFYFEGKRGKTKRVLPFDRVVLVIKMENSLCCVSCDMSELRRGPCNIVYLITFRNVHKCKTF